MKLRSFTTKAYQVINSICLIDTNQPEETIKNLIEKAISDFRKHINDLEVKDRFLQIKKNELSLFYVLDLFSKNETKRNEEMVNRFILLKSKEILNDRNFIHVALSLGFILLEVDEIQMLINKNKLNEGVIN